MDIITYEEEQISRADTAGYVEIYGTGRLTFEVAYDITEEAINKGLEDVLRKELQQKCKKQMLKMLHDAIEKLEGGEE